jgi:tetratricopeptide (TPR) repeat protein
VEEIVGGGSRGRNDGRSGRARKEGGNPEKRRRGGSGGDGPPPKRKPWSPESGQLPRWIAEELARVTPKARIAEASDRLLAAAQAFAAGRHGKALRHAEAAKELSPRDATVREVLGLTAYRMGRWEVALRELRTFRRLTGETVHLPVEIDVLRALERVDEVEGAWELMNRLGGDRSTLDEARVVFGSFLLDRDEARRAWDVTNPKRLEADPRDSEVRRWYVAARAAARLGDAETARRLFEAIQDADPAMPGMDDLDRAISES